MISIITGASGYVGGRIARAFRENGHRVLSLARRPCEPLWQAFSLGDDPCLIPWRDADTFVHAAYDFTARSWSDSMERNVNPSISLLRAACENGVRRTVFISSMSAFDGCHSIYGRSKLMVEKEAVALGATVVRPGLVWGPRPGGVLGAIDKLVGSCPIVPIISATGDLHQYLVHEDDLACAVLRIAKTDAPPSAPVSSLAYPHSISLRDIVRETARKKCKSVVTLPIPWRLAMVSIRSVEALGLNPPFRSDSLVGLVHANPNPEAGSSFFDYPFRPFR